MYFKTTETSVIKYRVEIDTQALQSLREEIITNCSIREKKEIKNASWVVLASLRYECQKGKNRAITYQVVGTHEYFDGPDEDILDIQYVEYTFPPIISYIDEVLKGNYTNLDLLLNPTFKEESKQPEDAQIWKKLHRISLAKVNSLEGIENTIQKLENIKETLLAIKERQELNKNRIPVSNYFEEMKACIVLTKIDEIDLDTYQRVQQFYRSDKVKTL